MSELPKIVFDVDGVILDVPSLRKKLAKEMFDLEISGKELAPKIFKKKFGEIYKELNLKLYRSPEVKIFPEVLGTLKRLQDERRDFILLSERRGEEEEKAQWQNLERQGVLDLVPKEKILIVRKTHEKIPVMQAFSNGEKILVIDDGLDKIEKFQEAGMKADWVWVDEFGAREEFEVPENVKVVSHLKEIWEGEIK